MGFSGSACALALDHRDPVDLEAVPGFRDPYDYKNDFLRLGAFIAHQVNYLLRLGLLKLLNAG